jgi:hypothetical protein
MKRTDVKYVDAALEILRRSHFGSVATVAPDGAPWNSPLVIEKDGDLNLYWYSDKTSRHAQNVRNDGRVMIVFYDSTTSEANARLGGLYIEAEAHECTDPEEVRQACSLRKGDANYPKHFMGRENRRVYKAVPKKVWVNDYLSRKGRFIRDYRTEVPLVAVRGYMQDG